jgi:multicomponent Na+:H+ antiporter subunit A
MMAHRSGWIAAALPAGLTLYFGSLIGPIAAGQRLVVAYPWVPSLGVILSFQVDGLSLLFALLISGIGTLVMVYSGGYLAGHHQLGRFFAIILAFMAAMLGLVLADNLLLLFAFWELTSLTSYLLIGFEHERPAARAAALQALLVTGAGELAMLAGLILLGQVGGSLELSQLLTRGEAIRADALYPAILLLILAGALTKSAQVPFHFWLPNAMEAPTPVSAYLHSATMVKVGIYLLARLSPVLGGTPSWQLVLTMVGTATMLVGAWLAVRHTDLKRILAYSTLSALGTLVMLLGIGSAYAATAAVAFLFGHALYKGALFLVAGAIDHETGTREVDRLGGLRGAMPITAAAAGLAALSMAGLPPFFGFIGKELSYEAVLGGRPDGRWSLRPSRRTSCCWRRPGSPASGRSSGRRGRRRSARTRRRSASGWGRCCWRSAGCWSGCCRVWPSRCSAPPARPSSAPQPRSTWRCGTASTRSWA